MKPALKGPLIGRMSCAHDRMWATCWPDKLCIHALCKVVCANQQATQASFATRNACSSCCRDVLREYEVTQNETTAVAQLRPHTDRLASVALPTITMLRFCFLQRPTMRRMVLVCKELNHARVASLLILVLSSQGPASPKYAGMAHCFDHVDNLIGKLKAVVLLVCHPKGDHLLTG